MKRLLLSLFAAATLLFGATKLNLTDVRGLANAPAVPYLLAFSAGAWIPVITDPGGSIVLDTSGGVAVLRATGASAQPVETVDVFRMAGTATFSTSAPARGLVDVIRNGMVMTETEDYTITGADGSIKTVGLSGAVAGDLIKLRYQK